jgi:hypothetical protein
MGAQSSPSPAEAARYQSKLARLAAILQATWDRAEAHVATAPALNELSPESTGMTGMCRTPDEAFAAGQRAGAADPPLDASQAVRVAALLAACPPVPVPADDGVA